MRWGVPRCEVFIAVGDQRRERVHMVGVLYHWNLIRLRDKREDTEKDKMDSDKERGKEGRERKKRGEDVNIWDVS